MKDELFSKMILVNIDWMNYYRGLNDDKFSNLKPKKYSEIEAYNFLNYNGFCYGGVKLKSSRINIDRIDPNNNGIYADDVLVVFTSYSNGNRIVGFYLHAKVYNSPMEIETRLKNRQYFFEAKVEDSYLIPVFNRSFKVNDIKIDFITDANVCFLDNEESKQLRTKIMKYVYDYINTLK